MGEGEKIKDAQISKQNISYYDEIASDYDNILNEDGANATIRAIVSAKFKSLVKEGCVLDFGGGTGRDLGWLNQMQYQIIFCEPSAPMRQIAIDRGRKELHNKTISFLNDDGANFRNWNETFPFDKKTDAVLANFAVINCIPDIKYLFDKMGLAIKPGGVFLALILDNSLLKRLRSNLTGTLKSFVSGRPMSFYVDYSGKRQQVYIHSTGAIRLAAEDHFEFIHSERLVKFGFCLIHLVRK
jgi:SAM-dependent methyltransferase